MDPNGLLTSVSGSGIVTLTLDRPAARNALDAALMTALRNAIREHSTQPATRVIVLRGTGTVFCAGADLRDMARLGQGDVAANEANAWQLAELLLAVRHCPKPTLAVVQGPALGGGVGLVAACDVALGGESAHFTLPEVRLGIVPAIISPYLAEAIGPRQARRYALTAERMDAATACQLGLLHHVVEDTALESEATRVGEALVAGGPQAMTTAKRLFDEVDGEALTEAQGRRLARRLAELRASEEAQEGLAAAAAKRKPEWCS